jgi:hypothetical protein
MKTVTLVAAMLVAFGMAFGDALFKGEVTDISGAAIGGAMIMIHWDSAGITVGLATNVMHVVHHTALAELKRHDHLHGGFFNLGIGPQVLKLRLIPLRMRQDEDTREDIDTLKRQRFLPL